MKELNYEVVQMPKWVIEAKRKAKARERYFIKRYGNLDRMHNIDGKLQAWLDEDAMADEMAQCK